MSTPKRNCRWCIYCTYQSEDWYYCGQFGFGMSKAKAVARRSCPKYLDGFCPCNDMDELSDKHINERELALYKRRMAGDWS